MKHFLTLFLFIFLTACQTTSQEEKTGATEENSAEETQTIDVEVVEEKEGLSDIGLKKNEDGKPIVYDNLWLKLAEGFTFEVPNNPRVEKQRQYLLSHPKHLKQISKRAEPFLYMIIEKIEKKGLPLELALLPVVESSFNPHAYSYVGAAGLWQFMPVTGDRFGLDQNWWYDGRKDIYRSSDAALRYMEILHNYLGDDWLRAFAAYNSGEGRVKRAVQKNERLKKPTDYWNLGLPRETEEYVPKMLALVDVLRNHKKYGIELPLLENKQVLTYVKTDTQLDLAYAGKLANLSVAEIQLLNPALNQWATPPKGPHYLLLPMNKANSFSKQLDKDNQTGWIRYIVKSGDNLSGIAYRNDTSTSTLKKTNHLETNFLKIGQTLIVPKKSKVQLAFIQSEKNRKVKRDRDELRSKTEKGFRKTTYTVAEGDNLWDISRLYNVRVQDISSWNQISAKKPLRLGHKLTIWQATKVIKIKVVSSGKRKHQHKVVRGDNLWNISKQYHVSSKDVMKWNNLKKNDVLRLGQLLTIKTPAIVATVSKSLEHKVVKGDTLWDISQSYGISTSELKKWNNLKKKSSLKLGQVLIIKDKKLKDKVTLVYKVQKGDSLSDIAQKFNVQVTDLMRWNSIKNQQQIKVGQNLKLFVKQVS